VLALNLNELGHSVSPLVQVLRAFVTHDVGLIVPSRGIDTSCIPGKVILGMLRPPAAKEGLDEPFLPGPDGAVTTKIPGDLFADSLTRLLASPGSKNAFCAKAALSTVLPVVRDVLRAILRELGGHSNTRAARERKRVSSDS
jgi:hypothetical protein